MKKKLLFVIESLSIGGAEKSLVTLLNQMDYSHYDVDLLLFSQGGVFQSLLPSEVNILPIPSYFAYNSIPWSNFFRKIIHPRMMFAQICYSFSLRCGRHNNTEKAVLLWRKCSNCIEPISQHYDMAIAYAQGLPTFFVSSKVSAQKKAAWINVTYKPTGKYLKYIKEQYQGVDYVNAVSESVYNQIQETFLFSKEKLLLIRDILDPDFAHKMASMPSNVSGDMNGSGVKILTVGRLAAMKGHDLAIDAARILYDRGIDFTWYAVGDGPLRAELESRIVRKGLQDRFVLLGSRPNPYPYFAACDIYVQSSKFEGFGITLAEAKMFGKPIITTNFDAVNDQFVNERNGLVVDISAEGLAEGVIRMISDIDLRERCINNVLREKIGNADEINKFYDVAG